MATSPFQRFRKHQKTFLAFLCVLLMVAFVLADMMGNPGGAGGQDPVVIETSAGNLRRSTLEGLRGSRSIANRFVQALTGMPQQFGPADDESLLNLYLMSHKAKSLGMVVSDEAINDFLGEFGPLTPDQVRRALDTANVNETQLFAALRPELQALWLQNQYFFFVSAWTPAERWRMFKRVHRQIDAEVLAVPVSAFADDVPTPSDARLEEFFAEYKDQLSNPASPQPGFTQPQRANFQYVVADYNAVVEKARESITDEDVRNYYDENKSLFRNPNRSEVAPQDDPRELQDSVPPARRAPGSTPMDSDDPAPDSDPRPQDGAALDDDTVGRTYPVALQDDADDTAADKNAGSTAGTATDKPAEDAPTENQPNENPPSANQPLLNAPGVENGQGTNPASPGEPATGEGGAAQSSAALPDRRTLEEIQREMVTIPQLHGGLPAEFEPLWMVKDEIRDRLAQQRAEQWILDGQSGVTVGLRALQAQVAKLTEKWREADLQFGDQPDRLDPVRKQLQQEALDAVRSGVESSNYEVASPTGMVTLQEMGELQLGQSQLVSSVSGVELPPNARSFAESFRRYTLFEPGISRSTDLDRNFYLFWKIDDKPSYTPETMQQVRDQVVAAWKRIEARKPAMDKALELEAAARKENKPLTEMTFGDQSGISLPPLTMMQQSFTQFGGPGLDWTPLPEEIEQPGRDLQMALFNLEDGEYAVSYNAPQDVVYVMHVKGSSFVRSGQEISPFIAHQNFIATPLSNYAAASQPEQIELIREWTSELHREFEVNIVGDLRFQ